MARLVNERTGVVVIVPDDSAADLGPEYKPEKSPQRTKPEPKKSEDK